VLLDDSLRGDLEVTVTGEGDHRGMLGVGSNIPAGHSTLRTEVRIAAQNADREQLEQLVRWADEHSPVGCTVRNSPNSTLTVSVP